MIVYRCMTDYAVNKAKETGYFEPLHGFSTRFGGLGKINGESCYNTFTHSQNQNLHFFKFAIDAIQYMNDEEPFWDKLKVCKFNIPEELLDKGFGFYRFQVRSEYVSKQVIPLGYLANVIDQYDEYDLFKEIQSDLDKAIYWHSTAGKAMTMTANGGLNMGYICGDIYHGGFMRGYCLYLDKLKRHRFYGVDDKFIEDCTRKNEEAYNNSTILEDRKYIERNPHTDYWNGLSYEEINKLFNGYEDLYINKTIPSIEDIQYKSERTRN